MNFANSRPNRKDYFCAMGGKSVTPADTDITFTAAVPADVNPPTRFPRAFSLGVEGTLKITTSDGSILTYASGELKVGALYPISCRRIWATGTTATAFKIYW